MTKAIRKEDILKCLPLLASILGKRYGVNVHFDSSKAETNGRIIYLPPLPLSDEKLLDQVRGYIDHESAHIRFTDFEAFARNAENPVLQHLMNIIEDWRVENAMCGIFPGCRGNLNKLIHNLFSEPYEIPTQPENAILNAILRTVRRWDVPTVSLSECLTFVDGHFPGLWPRIQEVLDKVRKQCASTDHAIEFAREIMAILQQYCKTNTSSSQERTETGSASCQDTVGGAKTERAVSSVKALLNSVASELPHTMGEYLQNSIQEACRNIARKDVVGVAKVVRKETSELSPEDIAGTRRTTTALRTKLQSLLQATTLNRSRPALRGLLHSNGLYRMMLSDPKVFLDRENNKSVDTAIHILLDSSGSMSKRIKLAGSACYAVAKALEVIDGVSLGISVFPSNRDGGIYPIVQHGSPVHNRFNIKAVGNTPLADTLLWTMQNMILLPQPRKIILIITDGNPDNHDSTVITIGKAQKLGFEVYGIGIKSDYICTYLPKTSRVIWNIEELYSSMFNMLHKVLLYK